MHGLSTKCKGLGALECITYFHSTLYNVVTPSSKPLHCGVTRFTVTMMHLALVIGHNFYVSNSSDYKYHNKIIDGDLVPYYKQIVRLCLMNHFIFVMVHVVVTYPLPIHALVTVSVQYYLLGLSIYLSLQCHKYSAMAVG